MVWLSLVSEIGWSAYIVVSIAIDMAHKSGRDVPPLFRAIRAELRPFALPMLLVMYTPDILAHQGFWDWFWLGLGLLLWWMLRNFPDDDDDRWKRRGKRLAEKVAEVSGKLIVVPAPEGA